MPEKFGFPDFLCRSYPSRRLDKWKTQLYNIGIRSNALKGKTALMLSQRGMPQLKSILCSVKVVAALEHRRDERRRRPR